MLLLGGGGKLVIALMYDLYSFVVTSPSNPSRTIFCSLAWATLPESNNAAQMLEARRAKVKRGEHFLMIAMAEAAKVNHRANHGKRQIRRPKSPQSTLLKVFHKIVIQPRAVRVTRAIPAR